MRKHDYKVDFGYQIWLENKYCLYSMVRKIFRFLSMVMKCTLISNYVYDMGFDFRVWLYDNLFGQL